MIYHFQNRNRRQEFLDLRADDYDHARQLIKEKGYEPDDWRWSTALNDLPPRR
jgi:hypothetical protein